MYSPSADANALSFVAPLPFVKHNGEWTSRICTDQTLGTRLRHDAISILISKLDNIVDMLTMVCSTGKSLPAIKVFLSAREGKSSSDCASLFS